MKLKPLHHKFEDILAELVDEFLLDGIDIEELKNVLRYEADHDHADRLAELLRKKEVQL